MKHLLLLFRSIQPELETEKKVQNPQFKPEICVQIDEEEIPVKDLTKESKVLRSVTTKFKSSQPGRSVWCTSSNKSDILVPLIESRNHNFKTKGSSLPIFTLTISLIQLLVFMLSSFSMRASTFTQIQCSYLVRLIFLSVNTFLIKLFGLKGSNKKLYNPVFKICLLL